MSKRRRKNKVSENSNQRKFYGGIKSSDVRYVRTWRC